MGDKPSTKAPDMMDTIMDLKLASRQMNKEANRAEQNEAKEKKKVAAALAKGNTEVAKIYAENAIRNKRESINIRRVGAKLEGLASKIQSAERTKNISQTMKSTLPLIQSSLVKMDKIGIGESLEDFERLFEDLDVKTADLNSAMDNVHASTTDQSEVDALMKQVSEENGLAVTGLMDSAGTGKIGVAPAAKQQDDLGELERKLQLLKEI